MKISTSVSIDEDLHKWAKERKVNFSTVMNQALKEAMLGTTAEKNELNELKRKLEIEKVQEEKTTVKEETEKEKLFKRIKERGYAMLEEVVEFKRLGVTAEEIKELKGLGADI